MSQPLKTGKINIDILNELYYQSQWWPKPPFPLKDEENYGRWLCDSYGIPRKGNIVQLSDLSQKLNKDCWEDIVREIKY